MEKDKLLLNEENTMVPTWNSSSFGMEIQSSELICGSEPLPYSFLNPNWDNSMDQSDPFESALSSMVSSPAASAAGIPTGSGGDAVVLRELIGRLGSICNSGEVSPQSYIGNNSTNTSCYSTPLNSPPKLNLSVMDQQIRGNFNFPVHPTLSPFSSDPGFAERAAKFSSFGSGNFLPQIGQFGLNESEFLHRLTPRAESPGLVSRVSSNHQSSKASASPMDKKFSSLSKSSNPENTEFVDSREGSSVSEQISGSEIGMKAQNDANARKRKSIPRGKVKEIPSSSPAKDAKVAAENEESNAKKSKAEESENGKAGGDGNQKQTKGSSKPPEPPKDYIHVRARRGQATDSHSLAERLRREKISERMKFLQDLVPGCNKVTGKAVMLDEIINYVQSLQRQVEFLSMKLATVNPRMDFTMETLLSKDIFQPRGSVPYNTYPLETTSPAFPHGFQSPPQVPSHNIGIPNGTESFSMNPFNAVLHQNPSMPLPPIDGFGEAVSQPSTLWEQYDLQSVVQMGFGQNQQQDLHGTMGTAQMKVEL